MNKYNITMNKKINLLILISVICFTNFNYSSFAQPINNNSNLSENNLVDCQSISLFETSNNLNFITPDLAYNKQDANFIETDSVIFYEPKKIEKTLLLNNIGITASFFSGYGIHYKRSINDKHAVKAVFFGWHESKKSSTNVIDTANHYYERDEGSSVNISFGLEYQFTILRAYQYSSYVLAGYRNYYDEIGSGTHIKNQNSFGVGIGTELFIGKRFVVSAEAGFCYLMQLERNWRTTLNGQVRYYEKDMRNNFGFAGGLSIGFVF